jgi:hypothetical protein
MKQHAPLITGLLLAATLVVDAIAIGWYAETQPVSRAAILYDALISAQLAIVVLWAVFSARSSLSGWVASIAAVIAASIPAVGLGLLSVAEGCGLYGSFVAILAAMLWMIRRSRLWQRLTGAPATTWQFSLMHMLAITTIVAVLITLLRSSPLVSPGTELWQFITLLTVGDALVVATTLLAWANDSHTMARLAAACGAAATLGVIEAMIVDSGLLGAQLALSLDRNLIDFMAYTVIMAVVIFVWLELVPLVPHARRAASLPPAGADAS